MPDGHFMQVVAAYCSENSDGAHSVQPDAALLPLYIPADQTQPSDAQAYHAQHAVRGRLTWHTASACRLLCTLEGLLQSEARIASHAVDAQWIVCV